MLGWSDHGGKRLILTGRGASIYRKRRHARAARHRSRSSSSRCATASSAGEYVSVQASGNGGITWTELGRISGPANDSSFPSQSYDITAYPRPRHRDPLRPVDERSLR